MANDPEYVNKMLVVEFVNRKHNIGDYYEDFHAAILKAGDELVGRYDVDLYPSIIDGKVLLKLSIPVSIVEGFNYGRRLRCVSTYLLSTYPEKYRPITSGNRFLHYVEIPESFGLFMDETNNSNIKAFLDLLNRTDGIAIRAKTQICDILNRLKYTDSRKRRR